MKLGSLCRRVNNSSPASQACKKKHVTRFVPCSVGVIYEVPTSCGSNYIGQTSRCVNDRLREHSNNIRTKTGSNLAIHCAACGCTPNFHQTRIVRRYRDDRAREIYEAFAIHEAGHSCISAPSIALTDKEINYLRNWAFHASLTSPAGAHVLGKSSPFPPSFPCSKSV